MNSVFIPRLLKLFVVIQANLGSGRKSTKRDVYYQDVDFWKKQRVVDDTLAIYDTIQYVKSEVVTICVGLAASMGAFLLAAGTKGKRVALPHSRIMIHQPLGGTSRRQASDIEIEAREILRMKEMLNRSLSDMSGQSFEKIEKDTDRDYFLSAEEAKDYGLIDRVISHPNEA